MDPLDAPVKLQFNNGNNFPPNFVLIAYVLILVSVFITVIGSYILGGILTFLCLLVISNRNVVIINIESNFIHEYNEFLWFIKKGKKYPLDLYKYITSLPLIESQQVYASASTSTTLTNNYTAVTMFGERLKGKRIITKFESKNEAEEVAKNLSHRLSLTYFEYGPKLVRQVMLGQRSI